jgi:hypothetical protein
MAHSYTEDDDVHHLVKGPQGRAADNGPRKLFTVIARLPIEADGRRRYRIKEKGQNLERVAYENELERPDSA